MHNLRWALILGGSSGFGLSTAKKLAGDGYAIALIHRDRRGAMDRVEGDFAKIRAQAPAFFALNTDALAPESRAQALRILIEKLEPNRQKIHILLHSIALGNLKPIAAPPASQGAEEHNRPLIEEEDMAQTLYAMGSSLLSWVQKIHGAGLFSEDARIFGLTSEGNSVAWKGYAAVSAAKATLEAISRSIAVEFAPFGLRCNILQPGVTDTPALRLIPNHESLIQSAISRNPYGRLTVPEDVANVISLLARPEAAWINGVVLRVDGGEHIAGS